MSVNIPADLLFDIVRRAAVRYAKVPPMAEYEIRWASKEPENSEEKQVLDKVVKGSGPMLLAELTD